ncbi:hypothetical protein L208DRAFT_1248765 [Tricholoma matsutake]|nr:hypothetical protein L208DRAFT_1248765 [Tricholoma matsutake 945]
MHLTPLIGLVLASLAPSVFSQQINFDSSHNSTTIIGTWSSGSRGVVTGPGFANPANESFFHPQTTGISYSFSTDGYYEIARYRFASNGSKPTCIIGTVIWVHGFYQLDSNGSISMIPIEGYQQVQDPCAANSKVLQIYNETELYLSWRIFTDPTQGYKLHLFQFDGTPLAPQFQVSTTPIMLPTQRLRNYTSTVALVNANSAIDSHRWKAAVVGAAGMVVLGVASTVL